MKLIPTIKKITIIALLLTIQSAFSQIPTPSAWWQAENNAQDSIGTNNGAIVSSFAYVPGIRGQAFSFAGGTVTVPDAINLDPATNLTVQIWVKGNFSAAFQYILAKNGSPAGASYAFYTGGNGGLGFWVDVPSDTGDSGLIISPLAAPAAIWDNNWHQATGVYDGTAVHLYVDGIEIGTGTSYIGGNPGGPGISYASAGPLVLGNLAVGSSLSWPGSIDEVKVFDRALAASDALDTFTNSTSTFATNGLASWWKADGNSLDSWGSNNGTVHGSTISFFQGKSGQGFLSAGGAIVVHDAPALEPQNITVQAWVKSTSPGTFKYVLSKCRAPTWGSYALYTSGNGGMAFYASIGSSGNGTLTLSPVASPSQVWDGAWHQVTGTYDGTALHLYIDAVEIGSGTPAPGGLDYTNTINNGAFVIASDPTLGFSISGGIDEVKLWDQALTPPQILATYTGGRLAAWWRAENNANDSVGTNNGTINGNVSYTSGRLTGSAFKLAGGVVVVPESSALEPTNITMEALVSASLSGVLPGANKYLVSKSFSPSNASYALATDPSGGLSFYVTLNGGRFTSPSIAPALIWDGFYHFVAGTYDGQKVRFFVDGNEIGAGTAASGPIQYGAGYSGGELLMGDFSDTMTSSNFVGLLDEIKIYNSALALSDIQADAFQPAFIVSQPQSASISVGSTISFLVNALPANAAYQWTFNGTNLPGATQAILTLTNIQAAQAGPYQVVVSVGQAFITNSLLGGQAFHLPNTVVDIPHDASLEPSSQVTVQAWVRNNGSPSAFSYILDKSFSGGVGSYALYSPGNGGAAFYIWLTGGSLVVSPNAGAAIWDGNWHQLTGVYDGEFVRLYVDGLQVGGGSDTFGGGTIEYTNGRTVNGDLYIGAFTIGGTAFGGGIDEVKVFNLGLSDADVLSTYTNAASVAATNGLISWYKAEGNAFDSFGSNGGKLVPPPGAITSSVATLTVTTTPAKFTNAGVNGGNFQSTLTGPTGQTYVIQRAGGLKGNIWTPIYTNAVPFTFNDAVIGNTNHFYRAVSQP